ncbi:MAG TPA: hypothetical protein VGZ22_12740 [Isosphaeraceae bacterium]|jgi:hypothetical protein|nr:hypothetical protein [Isosphaeraceae bacterium]
MRSILGLIVAAPIIASFTGCAATHQVRYVYQDGEFGVVGMPENTDRWPSRYRQQAEKLMAAHFPEGHEIVRAEEVVKGSRTLTVQGTNSAELMPNLPAANLMIGKLGRCATRSQADKVKIEECRIVYRKASRPGSPSTYAALATLTPTKYVSPNDSDRHSVSKHGPDDDILDEPMQGANAEKKKADMRGD